jgi:hypothetical protein
MDYPLLNTTSYPAALVPFDTATGASLTLIAKATFRLIHGSTAVCADVQHALMGADVFTGDPAVSTVRYESDFVPFKPRADALCVGRTSPPPHPLHNRYLVSFGVGTWTKHILVVGDRYWRPLLGRCFARPSPPASCTPLLVSFENAYGGHDAGDGQPWSYFAANAVGKGYATRRRALHGLALPNLEDPERPIRRWNDRPAPRSFGPVGRTWQPRLQKAGTYNQQWLTTRSPALPADFDEGYYNCAPEDQQVVGFLRGDEEIRVQNMHPDYPIMTCRLPGLTLRCLLAPPHDDGTPLDELPMHLDTLWVDMETLCLVLVWRGSISCAALPAGTSLLLVQETLGSMPRSPESYRQEVEAFMAFEHAA